MSNPITANEVAEKAQIPGASFSVSGTVYPKEGGAFLGEGTIKRTENEFVLHLTFPVGGEAPQAEGGTYSREDFWRFEGVIGSNLPIVIEHLAPCGTRHWTNGITSQEYDTHTLSLLPVGLDKMPLKTIGKLLERLQAEVDANDGTLPENLKIEIPGSTEGPEPPSVESPQEPATPSPYADGTWIHAVVLDFPLIHTNGGTQFTEQNDFLGKVTRSTADTFSGSFDGIEYGLLKRGEDLNVYLFLPAATDETIPVETHEQLLTSFLTGLAFATGQHCWPYRVILRQNGKQLLDKLHAVRKLDRTALAPFSERIGFNAKVGSIEWNFSDFLGKATRFFNTNSALSEAASKALWLLRAAGAKGIPGEITLSSLCVLLESLAVLMFEGLNLDAKEDAASFTTAKDAVKGWLEKHPRISETGFSRLLAVVSCSSPLTAAEKYRAVCEHLGLPWEGLMKDAWSTWKTVRHKSVHAALGPDPENPIHDHFSAVGRIAGAINVLVLRLIGYSGIARTSVFEDKHHKI